MDLATLLEFCGDIETAKKFKRRFAEETLLFEIWMNDSELRKDGEQFDSTKVRKALLAQADGLRDAKTP